MADVFIASDNIYSPLGSTTAENFAQLTNDRSGIRLHDNKAMSDQPFFASLFDTAHTIGPNNNSFTKFERLLIASISEALANTTIRANDEKTILIISSTKGNIDLLESSPEDPGLREKVSIAGSAKKIAAHFGFVHTPIVVSNACISGLLGITIGKRLIESGLYTHAVVAGADIISKFVLSGFQSFQAVSPEPCKPFDAARKGITLGEAAATMVLSADKELSNGTQVLGGAVSNDANHISAPSRTGAELAHIIGTALKDSGLAASGIDIVSAHGTATLYNDEMEAKALSLAGLADVPVNSLKGFYGHTLGAAGLLESILSTVSLQKNIILPTKGFETLGVETPLRISNSLSTLPVTHCLKTASGFGGCNAAVVFSKTI